VRERTTRPAAPGVRRSRREGGSVGGAAERLPVQPPCFDRYSGAWRRPPG